MAAPSSIHQIISSELHFAINNYIKSKSICAEIKISPGTLYGSLSKMEKDGLIQLMREEENRKIYCITALGTQVLDLEMKRIERLYQSMMEAK
ncbi:MAG: PadR family transcriptional regulator [Lachnospiraceae bacterium]|nr:PadR family transcriptional regulator [Lachnospiraceae bacterium]